METIKSYTNTYHGNKVDFAHPENIIINFQEVAYSLAKLCRFCGQIRYFYSVAEHQCLLYDKVKKTDPYMAKWLLVHDATESFINDIATPLKKMLPLYIEIEDLLEDKIIKKVGLRRENIDFVRFKEYDRDILKVEKLARHASKWTVDTTNGYKIRFWGPNRAYREYKRRLLEAFPHLKADFK